MTIKLNPDLERLAEFMQREFPAENLIAMANTVSALAPLLCGKYERGTAEAFVITSARLPADGQPKLTGAI
jgi:hypothetical protein